MLLREGGLELCVDLPLFVCGGEVLCRGATLLTFGLV